MIHRGLNSIRGKLILIIMSICLFGLLSVSLAYMAYGAHLTKKDLLEDMNILGDIIAHRSTAALSFHDQDLATENLNSLHASSNIVLACIYDVSQSLFAAYAQHRNPGLADCPDPETIESDTWETKGHMHQFMPILIDSEAIGSLYLRSDFSRISRLTTNLVLISSCIILVTVLVAFMAALGLQKLISQPVAHLAETAELVAKDQNYSRRAIRESNDEVGLLVGRFNDMLATIEDQNQRLERARDELELLVEKRTQQLQRANEELKSFSYSVSHDLRAPLRAINGFSEALLEDCKDTLDETGRDYLKRVCNASKRMSDLIDAMLSLSRVSNREMAWAEVDLSRTAQECVDHLISAEPDRAIQIHIQGGMTAEADAALMQSVYLNLLSNAWKFTRDTVHPVIEVGALIKDKGIQYFVRDNGAGFDMQYASKVFDAFQRLHVRDNYEGTGIGLATVARIIQRHGGEIWVEAAPQKGATFYFTLGH